MSSVPERLGFTWTEEEDDLLRRSYGHEGVGELAQRMGRSRQSLYARARVLRLSYLAEDVPSVTEPSGSNGAGEVTAYLQEAGSVERPDPELSAMARCLQALEPLGEEARARVIDWLCDRLSINGALASEASLSRWGRDKEPSG